MALNGVIGKPDDNDYFIFKANKGQTYDVRVFARGLRSPLDPVLYICKKGGGTSPATTTQNGPDSYLRFTAPEDAEYVLHVHDHLKKGGPDYAYRIEVTPGRAQADALTPRPRRSLGGTPSDQRGGAEGESPGDPHQRHPGRLRRRI